MTLSDKERRRFVLWLEMTADTCEEMAEQMEKVPGEHMVKLAKRERIKAASCALIACDLNKAETITIGDEK